MYHIMLLKNSWKVQLNVDCKKEEKYLVNHQHCQEVNCIDWWKFTQCQCKIKEVALFLLVCRTQDNL